MRTLIDRILGREELKEKKETVVTYRPVVRQVKVGRVTTILHMKKGKSVVGPSVEGSVYNYDSVTGEITGLTTAEVDYMQSVSHWLITGAAVTGEEGTTVRGENIDHITFKYDPEYKKAVTLNLKHVETK